MTGTVVPVSERPSRDLLPWEAAGRRGILGRMESRDGALERLSPRECMRLMATVPIGRLVYSRQALPAVEMVNFVLDRGEIAVKTGTGDKLAAAAGGAVVAFEADRVDLDGHEGWSVTVVGPCRVVTDDRDIQRLKGTGLRSWAPGNRHYFIVITPVIVNGRRVSAPVPAVPAMPAVPSGWPQGEG
jgi:hypothetical protein